MERFNRTAKQALGANPSRERLLYYVPILNVFRHMWPRFLAAMGRAEAGASDYTHVHQTDIDCLVNGLEHVLGSTFDELCRARDEYAFTVEGCCGGHDSAGAPTPEDPWDRVYKCATGNADNLVEEEEEDDMEKLTKKHVTEYEVQAITGKRRARGRTQYYVKWKGFPDGTWQDEDDLTNCDQAIQEFEQQQGKRPKRDEGDGDDDGDDPDVDYEVKAQKWWRKVTHILRFKTPTL